MLVETSRQAELEGAGLQGKLQGAGPSRPPPSLPLSPQSNFEQSIDVLKSGLQYMETGPGAGRCVGAAAAAAAAPAPSPPAAWERPAASTPCPRLCVHASAGSTWHRRKSWRIATAGCVGGGTAPAAPHCAAFSCKAAARTLGLTCCPPAPPATCPTAARGGGAGAQGGRRRVRRAAGLPRRGAADC